MHHYSKASQKMQLYPNKLIYKSRNKIYWEYELCKINKLDIWKMNPQNNSSSWNNGLFQTINEQK